MLKLSRFRERCRPATGLALAASLLAWAGTPAFGQEHRTFEEEMALAKADTGFRFGPLRLQPRFQIRDLGYDNNVYYTREGAPIADYTASVSLDLQGYLPVGRSLLLFVTESPEYRLFAERKELRTFTNNLTAGARLRLLNRFVFSSRYRYTDHLRRAYSEFQRQIRDINEGYEGAFFVETFRGSSIGFIGSVDDFRYREVGSVGEEIDLSRTLDRRETGGAVELNLPVFSRSLAFVRAGYSEYDFRHPESSWRNSRATYVSGGLRFPLLGRAKGAMSLGYKRFTPRTAGLKGYEGLIAKTDVDLLTGRFRWHARLSRDNRFSIWESALFYVDDEAAAGISYYLNRSLRLDYEFSVVRLDYPEPFSVTMPGGGLLLLDRRDNMRQHSLGFSVRLMRTIGISLSYNILDWTSTIPGFDIKRSFLGLGLTYDF